MSVSICVWIWGLFPLEKVGSFGQISSNTDLVSQFSGLVLHGCHVSQCLPSVEMDNVTAYVPQIENTYGSLYIFTDVEIPLPLAQLTYQLSIFSVIACIFSFFTFPRYDYFTYYNHIIITLFVYHLSCRMHP